MNVKYGDEIVEVLEELDTDGNGTIGMCCKDFALTVSGIELDIL